MERIAVFAALRWECRPVLRQMRQVARQRVGGFTMWRGITPRYEVVLVKTGMGIQQADAAARTVCERGEFALFVSTGCAGALGTDLVPGDVAVATAVVGDEQTHFDTDRDYSGAVQGAAERAGLRVTCGRVLCSPQALMTAAQKHAGAVEHKAVAVEMEGVPLAAAAAQRNIPFVSVRAILDTADTELKHTGRFIEPQTGAVKPLALAGYLATHPGAVADLLTMQRMMHAAESSLERLFAVWLSTLDS